MLLVGAFDTTPTSMVIHLSSTSLVPPVISGLPLKR
jgi:hypothetical protein